MRTYRRRQSARAAFFVLSALFGSSITVFASQTSVAGEDKSTPVEKTERSPATRHEYFTHGVHNQVGCDPVESCIAERDDKDPPDPVYPKWWVSDWTMYRVFNNYQKFPPPYSSPPENLQPSDYEVSQGRSYYDDTYVPKDGDGTGAMMEFYQDKCLPIFPLSNDFTCAFISLGNKAYFLRYEDRPKDTPQCCQFSLANHPPRTDFIKHLPYSKADSQHLNNSLQAYRYEMNVGEGAPPILFAYAFYKDKTLEFDGKAYQQPQSFYFSGSLSQPPDAPIVSQNYHNFRIVQPNPQQTWQQVEKSCPAKPEWCCLFPTDCPGKDAFKSNLDGPPTDAADVFWSDGRP